MKRVNRVGESFTTNEGYRITIIEYYGSRNCSIKFETGVVLNNKEYADIKKGVIKNPFHTSVYDVGYIGIGNAKVWEEGKNTKGYSTWNSMISRCYSEKTQNRQPTYIGCSVDERWHNFQTFSLWFEENYKEGFALDKDILIKGNKIYSPDTCCFVPQEINSIFKKTTDNKEISVGVKKHQGRFLARLRSGGVLKHIGMFNTPEEAFQAYKEDKEAYIKEVAEKWKDKISYCTYFVLINFKV